MANKERQQISWETEAEDDEDQSTALVQSSWLPEQSQVIDDVISELNKDFKNKKELRDVVTMVAMYPEGVSLEEDFGYVMCQPSRRLIVRFIHSMLDVENQFRGLVYRDKAVLTTVLISFGLIRIEEMLTKRRERIQKEWEDLLNDKIRYSIQQYGWKTLAASEKGDMFYKYNYYVLDPSVRGRLNKIKREYRLSRAFLVEMSIVEAIRTSRLFPKRVIEQLNEEHEQFEYWTRVKETVDTIGILPEDKS